jgi:hypothetical protein
MTTIMESALSSTAARGAPAVAPYKPNPMAEVAKPAVNPFSKVINKANTPAKPKQAVATPVLQSHSRPATSAADTGGAGSANIVKSRTVTSFVSGSGAGASKAPVTSFLNNENAGVSSSNTGGVTSFLKSKDSGSASLFKHRSVSITNGKRITRCNVYSPQI